MCAGGLGLGKLIIRGNLVGEMRRVVSKGGPCRTSVSVYKGLCVNGCVPGGRGEGRPWLDACGNIRSKGAEPGSAVVRVCECVAGRSRTHMNHVHKIWQ